MENLNHNNPECYVPNDDPYPLCVGNGSEKCHECCIYEDYEKYNDPYSNYDE